MRRFAGMSLRTPSVDQAALERLARQLEGYSYQAHVAYSDQHTGLLDARQGTTHEKQPAAKNGDAAVLLDGQIYNIAELRAKLGKSDCSLSSQNTAQICWQAYREYDDAFLEQLNGMFALALVDQQRQRLLLARDRLGIKPLFLRHLPNGVAFASEAKMLLPFAGKPAIDPQGLAEFFAHQFIGGQRTIWADIEKVMPGEAIIIEAGHIIKRWRYWDARRIETQAISYEAAAAQFDTLFEQVCREHLPSAAPPGLLLSGGVDSTTILAQLHQLKCSDLAAYSAGFPVLDEQDELPRARAVAARFKVPLTAIKPSTDDLLRALPQVMWAADDLMYDLANLPTFLLAQAVSENYPAIFSGEGADEVFGGYGRYRARFEDRLKALRWPGSGGFRTRSNISSGQQRQLYRDDLLESARQHRAPFIEAWQSSPASWSTMQRRQYVDLVTALPDNLMVKVDRLLASNGVEARLPFLDHRIVEFGFSLPDSLKLRDGHGKWFLKTWASRFLEREQLFARKRGFRVPLLSHIDATMIEQLRQILPEHAGVQEWFRPQGVRTLLAEDAARGRLSQTAFSIMQFALWHTFFVMGDGSAPPDGIHPLELLETGT